MQIHCPKCNQQYDVSEDHIGKEGECTICKHEFAIQSLQKSISKNNKETENDEAKCPFCCELIKKDAIKCRYCGEFLSEIHEHEELLYLTEDQASAVEWAKKVLLCNNNYVILDTETTGLKENDEIIQMSVINLYGEILFDEKIYPTKKKSIPQAASNINGLTIDKLKGCPTFAECSNKLKNAIGTKNIIAYNAEFDQRLYAQSYKLNPQDSFLPSGDWLCAMIEYAKFVGEWNEYFNDYKWQKLEGGDHTALGDCLATLKAIKKMALTKYKIIGKSNKEPQKRVVYKGIPNCPSGRVGLLTGESEEMSKGVRYLVIIILLTVGMSFVPAITVTIVCILILLYGLKLIVKKLGLAPKKM